MDRDIAEFLQNCGTCQKTKLSRNAPNLLTPSSVCSKTLQQVHVDMIAAPVASGNNNRYILSFTNAVSKYTELMAISDRTAETVAKAIFTIWICRYGVPTEIITNQENRKVSNLASSTSSGLAKCRSSTANEFQNL
jgi:hypothetical protein